MNIDHLRQLHFNLSTDPAHFNIKLDEMLHGISAQLPEMAPATVVQKIKWVLTEMVTNAYKHAGVPDILLRVQFHPGELHIIKEDSGTPLHFSLSNGEQLSWPLSDANFNREVNIFTDDLNVLNALIDHNGNASFSLAQRLVQDKEAREMNEHFGLIIIAGVCDAFSYVFDRANGRNIFTSVLRYDNS